MRKLRCSTEHSPTLPRASIAFRMDQATFKKVMRCDLQAFPDRARPMPKENWHFFCAMWLESRLSLMILVESRLEMQRWPGLLVNTLCSEVSDGALPLSTPILES